MISCKHLHFPYFVLREKGCIFILSSSQISPCIMIHRFGSHDIFVKRDSVVLFVEILSNILEVIMMILASM